MSNYVYYRGTHCDLDSWSKLINRSTPFRVLPPTDLPDAFATNWSQHPERKTEKLQTHQSFLLHYHLDPETRLSALLPRTNTPSLVSITFCLPRAFSSVYRRLGIRTITFLRVYTGGIYLCEQIFICQTVVRNESSIAAICSARLKRWKKFPGGFPV
jgi:hypothetical protein